VTWPPNRGAGWLHTPGRRLMTAQCIEVKMAWAIGGEAESRLLEKQRLISLFGFSWLISDLPGPVRRGVDAVSLRRSWQYHDYKDLVLASLL
jgi:hypothetical protein